MEHPYLKFYRSSSEARADVESLEEQLNSNTSPEEKAILYGVLA